jgi:hypothetical protein
VAAVNTWWWLLIVWLVASASCLFGYVLRVEMEIWSRATGRGKTLDLTRARLGK